MISGSIGSTRSGRYTLVPRCRASRSSGLFERTKCDTSAMCTPSRQWPFSIRSSEMASSKSRASTGSIVMLLQVNEHRGAAGGVERAIGGDEYVKLAIGVGQRFGRTDEAKPGLRAAEEAGDVVRQFVLAGFLGGLTARVGHAVRARAV